MPEKKKNTLLYMKIYNYYKDLIINGAMSEGAKLASIRRCAEEFSISRTTVETAYMQLAADGYIISKAQSGFYVSDIGQLKYSESKSNEETKNQKSNIKYDFKSANADSESFNFNLWRRYIKSALRQDERLLTYGEPQGEQELRNVLARYIGEKRNIVCNEDNIVIGAGVQSLLHIVSVILNDRKSVSFVNNRFELGAAVFEDHGFEICRNTSAGIIYVTPSHPARQGGGMNVNERLEIIKAANRNKSIIIEDDYENEFCYIVRPTASIQSLSGGHNVIYIGSFSRLLLPSIRISFMILPSQLIKRYRDVMYRYNQTASKTEQMALCSFIRDGHLSSQIRRLRKLYTAKARQLAATIKDVFGDTAVIAPTDSVLHIKLILKHKLSREKLLTEARKNGVSFVCPNTEEDCTAVILSCTSVKSEDFETAVNVLKKCIDESRRK